MPKRPSLDQKARSAFKTANKHRRQSLHIRQKTARDKARREERLSRRREEEVDPRLKESRLSRNVQVTLDKKRRWDEVRGGEEGEELGLAVDVVEMEAKRRKMLAEEDELGGQDDADLLSVRDDDDQQSGDSDVDSMLEDDELDSDVFEDAQDELSGDEAETSSEHGHAKVKPKEESQPPDRKRGSSPVGSTMSTRLDITPEALATKFPTLFDTTAKPKILITTSINSTLHAQAGLLTELFPNSSYVRRSAHRFGHKYSVREISKFAANRDFTTLLVLMEDQKRPCGLVVVHLPVGPTFHFTISNWLEGKKLPGHGNPTNHYPELILNNFRTPLGLLTAHLFRTMFPPQPEHQGRQVVTLHNQRDYIFFRRHRYVFRDRRETEKQIIGGDGKPVKGVEGIRAGLQELGPRFTLKLRRVDRGIQRGSGQEWEWKAGDEKVRTRFQL